MYSRRELWAAVGGAVAAVVLGCWASTLLPLLGLLALAWCLSNLAALFVAPSLPRRLLPGLARRAVFITGCDTGFGHAAALRLDALGVRVFAGVLLPQGDGAQALRSKASPRLRVLPLDVTKDDDVAAARDVVTKELEQDDCELWSIVNNAGIFCFGESDWMHFEDIVKSMNVNFMGAAKVTKAFLPLLKKSKGRIISMNSPACRTAFFGLAPYTISKYALLGYTESLRVDLMKFAVSVYNIEPALYKTAMFCDGVSTALKTMEAMPHDEFNIYGDEYREKIQKISKYLLSVAKPETSISEVIDSIEDACLSDDPQDRYLPGDHSKFFALMISVIGAWYGLINKLLLRIF